MSTTNKIIVISLTGWPELPGMICDFGSEEFIEQCAAQGIEVMPRERR